MTPDHPNALPLELLPNNWWIYTIRELNRNKDEDLQIDLEQISSAFSANYMVILMNGYVTDKGRKLASGLGKSLNEAFMEAIRKIPISTGPG